MLTAKQNLLETIKPNGNPDRYVKQFEFLNIIVESPYFMKDYPFIPGTEGYDQYGVKWSLPVGQMGAFPVHDDEHRLLKDICEWRDVVTRPMAPPVEGFWQMLQGKAAATDKDNQFLAAFHPQGVFERLHALMGMEDCFVNFYDEPEETAALIDFITEVELEYAKNMIEKLHIEAIFHHDDWGATTNSFLPPAIFEEFIVPAYKKIYGYYKDNGVLVVHHNDGYAANLVDYMVEMGMDIWQGVIPANNIKELVEKTEGKLTFMGEIQSKELDIPGWTEEKVAAEVERACKAAGTKHFIPCLTAGLPITHQQGLGPIVDREIDRMSKIMFN